MDESHIYKYNYRFLYQSIAVYATTLAGYILIRGLLIEKEFTHIFRDPLVYLLCAIILFSALAVLYNAVMQRRIELAGDTLLLRGALREIRIERQSVRQVRAGIERQRGAGARARVVKIFLKNRRRPALIRTYNFERDEALYAAIKRWAGDLLSVRPGHKRGRS